MDIIEILFLLLFFVLPILQQLLGKRDKPEVPPSEPREEGDEWDRLPTATAERDPDAPLGLPPGWEWEPAGSGPVFDEETLFEVAPDEEEVERVLAQQRARPVEEIPEAVRVAAPVVSLERLHVDRVAEHQRFHTRAPTAPPPVRKSTTPLSGLLGSRRDLRRAIVLAEVLGPPRALRPPEG